MNANSGRKPVVVRRRPIKHGIVNQKLKRNVNDQFHRGVIDQFHFSNQEHLTV